MPTLLTHPISVAGLVPGRPRRQSKSHHHQHNKEYEKPPRSVKMMCGTGSRMSGFSALRTTLNPLYTNAVIPRRRRQDSQNPKVPGPGGGGGATRRRCVPENIIGERLTDEGVRVMMLAEKEAKRHGQCYVGAEHILLGLIGEGIGVAARVLASMGISLEDARLQVQKITESRGGGGGGGGAVFVPSRADIPSFTPRLKRVFDSSTEAARKLGSFHIKTEHLLLGVLREDEGVATCVLENMGVDPTEIRTQVFFYLAGERTDNVISNENMPTLEKYGTNLTKLAKEEKLDPVVGRQHEIDSVTQILLRHTKNNPCLIGAPGIGKTAIVKGLAQWIANDDVPETLRGKQVITLDRVLLAAGSKYHEERLKKSMEEIKQSDNKILFIGEVHTLIGAANILKQALARGELQCILATTVDEYRKHIEKDPALEKQFQPIKVPEPTVEETIQILEAIKERYEIHHQLRYSDEALVTAAVLSHKYIRDRYLPDKAIHLFDEAGSWVRLQHAKGHAQLPEQARQLEKEMREIVKEKEEAIRNHDFENAMELGDMEMAIKAGISILIERSKLEGDDEVGLVVTKADIQHLISSWTGIPIEKVSDQ